MDLLEPRPALLVQRGRPDLLQQLADHAPDSHDLGRLLDHLGDGTLAGRLGRIGLDGDAVRADHHHGGVGLWFGVCLVAHVPSLSRTIRWRIPGVGRVGTQLRYWSYR